MFMSHYATEVCKCPEKLGKLTIALMLDKDGSMILFLRDFDQPPFLPEWWEDPFDPTFFGLGYRFEKAAQ